MSYLINEDMRMLRESADKFFWDADPIRALRRGRESRDLTALGVGQWPAMVEMGFAGVLIPDDFGGAGLGCRGGIQIAEMMGRSLATGPFIASAVMGVTAMLRGECVQRNGYLSALATGDMVLVPAIEESSRHRPERCDARAVADGTGWRLSGRKIGVLDGNVATHFVVAARENSGEIGLFVVDAATPGVSLDVALGLDSRPSVTVVLDSAASLCRLAASDRAASVVEAVLDAGRLHLAAELVGLAQEAFDRAVEYLKTRVQFGRKIGEFQALQHRAAILLGELEIARSVVLKAAFLLDTNDPAGVEWVSLAKARVGETACHVTTEAVQFHGGIGVTDEFDIGLFLKRARAAADQLGDSAFHTERWARLQGL